MNAKAAPNPANRLLIFAAGAFLWAVLILLRLVELQVVQHSDYKRQAEQQQQHRIEVRAPRGTVFDRTGHPLAMSLPADTVCINPRRVPDKAVAAEILASVLNLDRNELSDKIEAAASARRGFLPIKKKISFDESERLRSLGLDWIEFRTESQRFYPNGELAANLLGAVNFEERGNAGLERGLDKELRGHAGTVKLLTDVRQRGVDSEVSLPARPGVNLTLTIDERIQYVAERELKAAVESRHARSGSVLAMDPYTGDILAMASYPTFDPNEPPKPNEDPMVRFNQAVSVPFEPGSVFKVITLSAAIDEGKVTPDTPINCGNGALRLMGRVIHEAKHGYGTLSVADVLAKSSNIGAIQVGLRLGDENLLKWVRKFGFGSTTGISLPAESPGMVRDLKHWGKTSIGSVAMGHEISTTTVQLARACAVVANGGLLVKPRLVLRRQRIGAPAEIQALASPVRVMSPETAIKMRQMMEGVVVKPYGTGRRARLDGYSSGGKTGSAQIFDFETKRYTHLYNASFIGFAPVTNPKVVVAVTVNATTGGGSGYGGVVAAPVFRAVAMEALRVLDVPKDLPEAAPPIDSADTDVADGDDLSIADLGATPEGFISRGGLTIAPVPLGPAYVPAALIAGNQVLLGPAAPSFLGKTMRSVFEESTAKGVRVEAIGNGIARAQMPPPGSPLVPGQRVRVQFAR